VDHTPKDEEVRLYLGNAFDVVGQRAQTDFRSPVHGPRDRGKLRNQGAQSQEVRAEVMYTNTPGVGANGR